MDLDPALRTYVAESRELLLEMEDSLLRLEQEDNKDELLNAIFRAAHTIKGSAGLFGLDDIVAFAHGVESVLDRLRAGEIAVKEDIVALMLACGDHISDLIDHVDRGGLQLAEDLVSCGNALTARLKKFNTTGDVVATATVSQIQDSQVSREPDGSTARTDNWHISIRFGMDSLRDGMDPLSIFCYLGTFGRIVSVSVLDDRIPSYEEMDPESCYLGFEIGFSSDADKLTIENAFEFIREESLVRILPPHSRLTEYLELLHELPEEEMFLGEILVRCGSLTPSELNDALRLQESVSQPLGGILVDRGMISQVVVDAAVERQTQVRESKTRETQSIRVDADKLDILINLIGELVISGAGTSLYAHEAGNSSLIESVSTLSRLVEEVRDAALRLRMVQIGATFNRFQRVVRDMSKELNKEIDLVITGAETELDKTVVEKIGDPLMHLVRNSIDHGIEAPEIRLARGKSASGVVQLNAYHDSGSIVIEVSDDGGGLNADRILSKAIEKGLVAEGQQLELHEIYNLIFQPGFSTADQVTNLSGRGVGMDVVKSNITELRGTVDVMSTPGEGTVFRVRLPLTLAIIDGFLVGVSNSSFVVPLDMVLECVELNELSHGNEGCRDYIDLRGEVLPFISLREVFSLEGQRPRRESVVVVQSGGIKAGLVVDRLMGEFQTVIKPLGKIFTQVRCISGSTILGSGEVALIIDVPGLVHQVTQREAHVLTAMS